MRIEKFSHGQLTITFTANDCAVLGHCLTAASDNGAFDKAGAETEATLCEAMASVFTLGAVAGASQGWIALSDHGKLIEDLVTMGLSHLVSGGADVLVQAAAALGD